MPNFFQSTSQKRLVNFESLSEVMFFCIPWCFTTLSKYNQPTSCAIAVSRVGIKCAILLTLSTTTMMESNPLDSGRWVMKSIETLSQHLVGMAMVLTIRPLCETEFYFAGKSHMTLHIAPRRPASLANSNSSPTLLKLVSRHDAPRPDHCGTPSKVPTLTFASA